MANNTKRVRSSLAVDGNLTVDGTINGVDLAVLAGATPTNYVKSGRVRPVTGSDLPAFLVPDGVNLSVVLEADGTDFEAIIDGASVVVSSDVTKSSLTAAPSTQNTALINNSAAADQADTRVWGEWNHRRSIIIDNAGTEITALIGKLAAFQISGVGTEYFIGYVKSATEIVNCVRGFFYDSASEPVKPTAFSDNDTLTLLRLTWIFLKSDGTLDAVYRQPSWSKAEPTSPSANDYWYDIANATWKKYNGSAFLAANATLIGMTAQSASACVAARSMDFYAQHNELNTLLLELVDTEVVRAEEPRAMVAVAGEVIDFGLDRPQWDITADLAGADDMYDATEQASTLYWLYLKKDGTPVISDISPIRRPDLRGRYHRYNMWRCVGWMLNNSSSDVQGCANWNRDEGRISLEEGNGFGSTYLYTRRWANIKQNTLSAVDYNDSSTNGATFTVLVDGDVDAWGIDFNTANPSVHGWVFNGDTVISNPSDRDLDTRNVYSFAPTGNPQSINVYAICKIGEVIRFNCDDGSPTDGTNQVDAIMKFLPGKEV